MPAASILSSKLECLERELFSRLKIPSASLAGECLASANKYGCLDPSPLPQEYTIPNEKYHLRETIGAIIVLVGIILLAVYLMGFYLTFQSLEQIGQTFLAQGSIEAPLLMLGGLAVPGVLIHVGIWLCEFRYVKHNKMRKACQARIYAEVCVSQQDSVDINVRLEVYRPILGDEGGFYFKKQCGIQRTFSLEESTEMIEYVTDLELVADRINDSASRAYEEELRLLEEQNEITIARESEQQHKSLLTAQTVTALNNRKK